MNEFFTSDLHLGHGNIIKYCSRPFRDADHMNQRLIANINERCKKNDTLYHLGDFCCYGKARGVEGMRKHSEEYEAMIKPKLIHLMGNHDKNNKTKGLIYGSFMIIGDYQVWATHKPPWDLISPPENVTAYLCGHVHDKWQVEKWHNKPVINVGCDVWNYRPIRKDELINFIKENKTDVSADLVKDI